MTCMIIISGLFIPKVNFPIYPILIFIGIVVTLIVISFKHLKKIKGKSRLSFFIFLYLSIFIFLSGAYLLDNFFHYLNNERFGSSGVSFLGGALPLLIFYFFLLTKNQKKDLIFDLVSFLPFIHSLGRIGCLFAGCCYGIPFSFGIYYDNESLSSLNYGEGTVLFPTQIVESIVLIIIFSLLLTKWKNNPFSAYCISYGVYRFIFEFFRGDNRGSTLTFLSPSQLMSIILIALGISYLFKLKKSEV